MINKAKNINLQITISRHDAERLNAIQTELSERLNIELSKSQTIAFLIRNYGADVKPTPTKEPTPKSAINYGAQIKALMSKLGVSFTRLSEILSIPTSTLKKYAYGKQQPKAENEQILLKAFTDYGIK